MSSNNITAFNQNPVFSVLADDGASTPGRDRQSPSHGSARGRGKLAKSIIERDYPSDTDRTRSASPPGSVYNTGTAKKTPNMRINTLLNDEAPSSTPAPKGPGRGNWSRNRNGAGGAARNFKAKLNEVTSQDGQSPSGVAPVSNYNGPHGFYLPLNGSDPSHKRTRPLTQHQLAVEQYRRRRVEVILDRGLRIEYKAASKRRKTDGSFMRTWIRCKGINDGYDTDEESEIQRIQQMDIEVRTKTPPPMFAGLVPLDYGGEVNDCGEEAYWRNKMLNRAVRRMDRWEGGKGVVRTKKAKRRDLTWMESNGHADGDDDEDEDEEMQDAEETERRDRDEIDSDEEDEVYDRQPLPRLSSLSHA